MLRDRNERSFSNGSLVAESFFEGQNTTGVEVIVTIVSKYPDPSKLASHLRTPKNTPASHTETLPLGSRVPASLILKVWKKSALKIRPSSMVY